MVHDMLLETRSLTKEFRGFRAVSDVDLVVRDGTIHALVGPTAPVRPPLLNLPTGFLGPTSGSVHSAGLASLAGGVFAISHGFTSLQELNWTTSGKVVLITVLGGIGTLWGGPVGAAIGRLARGLARLERLRGNWHHPRRALRPHRLAVPAPRVGHSTAGRQLGVAAPSTKRSTWRTAHLTGHWSRPARGATASLVGPGPLLTR
jgi:hypothetical protein